MSTDYEIGDWVVYQMSKVSTHPGPRARDIHRAEHGEDYRYTVEKYWVVAGVTQEGNLKIRTRTGKYREVRTNDPLLRKANVLDRWLRKSRFPNLDELPAEPTHES